MGRLVEGMTTNYIPALMALMTMVKNETDEVKCLLKGF